MIKVAQPFFGKEEQEAAARVIASGNVSAGIEVKKFEEAFAKHVHKKHAIAVSSGTSALMAAIMCRNRKGDTMVPAFSFPATALVPDLFGNDLIFVDITSNFCMSHDDMLEKITPTTEVAIPVHLYGRRCDEISEIYETCMDYGITCITDSCQAPAPWSADYTDIACYSFYATKNITTGEGGMIVTNDDSLANEMRMIINHGQSKKYYHVINGINMRMTDIAAAIGSVQLAKYESIQKTRHKIAKYYSDNIESDFIRAPQYESTYHEYHLYTVLNNIGISRERMQRYLQKRDIETSVHYPYPIYKQPIFRRSYLGTECPITEIACSVVLSLPCHPNLTEDQIEYIVETINNITRDDVLDV